MFKFTEGRQGSGYFKMCLISILFFDCYLLKFPKDSYIEEHIDPVEPNKKHHRVNVVIWKCSDGGEFIKNDQPMKSRIQYFNPSDDPHSVSKVNNGTRWVLSFGWLTNR